MVGDQWSRKIHLCWSSTCPLEQSSPWDPVVPALLLFKKAMKISFFIQTFVKGECDLSLHPACHWSFLWFVLSDVSQLKPLGVGWNWSLINYCSCCYRTDRTWNLLKCSEWADTVGEMTPNSFLEGWNNVSYYRLNDATILPKKPPIWKRWGGIWDLLQATKYLGPALHVWASGDNFAAWKRMATTTSL